MKIHLLCLLVATLAGGLPVGATAQDSPLPATEENAKALKYHEVLVKRPSAGYLFDRFFGAWLEGGTVESLEEFLNTRSSAADAVTGDRLLLAFFHVKQGEDAQALEVFAKALEADPKNAEAWLEKARAEARTLDFEAALADLEKADEAGAADDDEQAAEVVKLRGRLLARVGRSDEALEVWRELLAGRSEDEELHEDVIELLVDEGLYAEAIETAKKLAGTTADPYQKVQRQLIVGDLHQRSGNREEALAAYADALTKTGHGTWIEREILAQIEQLYRREDDIDGLSFYLADLLKEDGKRMALRQRRASALVELGEDEQALEAWKEILALTPGDRAVREAYVAVLAKMERFDDAIAQLKALTELHPEDVELVIAMAELQYSADDAEAAAATVLAFLEASDKSEYAYLRAARLLQRFGRNEPAENVYQKLLAAFPDSVGARETFANFLHDTKRRDEALLVWRQLAATNDSVQVVRVGRALAARGESEEAFALVRGRFDDLKNDSAYLAQLIELALRAKEADEAFDWVRRRLLLVASSDDLVDVTGQALLVVRLTGETQQRIAELRADADGLAIEESCLLAELLNEAGDFEAAVAVLDEIAAAPGGAEDDKLLALAQKARLHVLRKDWSGAADAMRVAVELPGGRKSSTVQMLVEMYQRAAMTEEALHWIAEWKKLSPGGTGPWLREASVQLAAGDIDTGLKTLRSAARRFTDSEEIRLTLASSLLDAGKVADAESIYWQLYDDEEDSLKKLNWAGKLAQLASDSGRQEHLIGLFEERKRRNRGSVVPLLALAEIYRVDDRYEERREAIIEASRLQPNDIGLLHQLAGIDEAEGNLEGALKSLSAALELDKTGRTRQRIVRLHFLSGEYEKGLEALQAGTQGGLAATDPYLVEEVWSSIVRTGEWERSVAFLRPFLSAQPENYRLQYLYAVALEEAEQFAAAMDAFGALLDYDQEVPPPANANTSNQQQQNYTWYGGSYYTDEKQLEQAKRDMEAMFPKEAIQIQQLRMAEYQAYHYRQGRGEGRIYGFGDDSNYYYYGWGGTVNAGSTLIVPPGKVDTVSGYAFSHLTKIAQKLGEAVPESESEPKKALEALAQQHGCSALYLDWMEFSRDMESLPQEEQVTLFSRWLAKHPASETANALWAMGWASNDAGKGEVDTLAEARQVVKMFRESRPALALNAALIGANYIGSRDVSSDKFKENRDGARLLVEEALALSATVESVPVGTFQQAFFLLQSYFQKSTLATAEGDPAAGNNSPDDLLLTDAQAQAIEVLLRQWQPDLAERYAGSPQGDWARIMMLSLAAIKGDMAALVAGFESELQRHREQLKSGGSSTTSVQNGYDPYSGQQIGSIMVAQPVTFPPMILPDMPAMLMSYFSPNRGQTNGGIDWRTEENLKKLGELLPGIGDPLLRVLMAHLVGADADPIKLDSLAALENAEPPTLSGLILVAAHAATVVPEGEDKSEAADQRKDHAAELFEKARLLSTQPTISNFIDAALVSLGQEGEPESVRFEKGKAAALRIRSLLKPDQIGEARQLADVLRRFGLDKEASVLSLNLARAQSAQSQSQGSGVSLGAMSQPQDPEVLAAKLKQLIEQGKRDSAVSTAVQQIKLIAAGLLGADNGELEYQMNELREVIEASSLSREIIEQATPAEDAKLVERVQFAALCEAVGDSKLAISAYRKLIEERPSDDALRMRLVVLLGKDDPEAALAEIDGLKSPGMLNTIAQTLSNRVDYARTIEEKLGIAELTLRLFEKRSEDFDTNQLYWLKNLRQEIAGDIYSENFRLPPLLSEWDLGDYDNNDGYVAEKFDELLKRRADLHERYCRAMIGMPELAAFGFAYLAAQKTSAGEKPEVVAALAREVVGRMEHSAFIGNNFYVSKTSSSWSGGSSGEGEMKIFGPIETVVANAFGNDDRAAIYGQLLPELAKEPKKKDLAEGLRAYAELYFCEPADFGKAIDGIEKFVSHYGERIALLLAANAYRARDIDYDLGPKLEELLGDPQNRSSGMENVLPELVSAVAERRGNEAALVMMEIYAERMLGPGPAETRRAYIKRHYVVNSWSGNTPNGDIHSFEQFLGNCGQQARLIFPALHYAAELKLGAGGRIYELEAPFVNSGYADRADFVTAWLENSPLGDPLSELGPMDASGFQQIGQNGRHTVLGAMIHQIGRVAKDKRQPIEEFIKNSGNPVPVGVRLLASRWQENPSLAAANIFHEAVAEIREMPEQRQIELAGLAADLIEDDKLPKDLDANVAESWKFYQDLAGAGVEDQLSEFLAAKTAADLGMREYQLDDHAKVLITRLLGKDLDQAVAVFAKTVDMMESARRIGTYRSSYSGGRTFGGDFLHDIARSARPLDFFLFETAVVTSEDIPPVSIFTRPKLSNMVREWNKDSSASKSQLIHLQKIFVSVADGLGENPSATAVAMAAPVFFELIYSLKHEVPAEVRQWVAAGGPEVTAHPELATELALAALAVPASPKFQSKETEGNATVAAQLDAEADGHYLGIVRDQSVTPAVRLMFVSHLLGADRPRVSDELLVAACEHLASCWSADIPVADGQAILVLDEIAKREGFAAKEEIGGKLASAFSIRYLSGSAPQSVLSKPDSNIVLGMVRLNLDGVNPAAANQILSRFDDHLGSYTEPFLLLVRAGEHNSAGRLLRKQADKFDANYGKTVWDPQLASASTAFLDTLTRTETRLLGHALLAATPDKKVEPLTPDRVGRLQEVGTLTAAAIAEGEQMNTQIREQILSIIALEPKAAGPVAELYAADLAERDINSLFQIDEARTRERRFAITRTALLLSLMKGESEPYASTIVAASAAPSQSSYYKRQFMNPAVKLPYQALVETDFDAALFEKLLPAWERVLLDVPMTKEIGTPEFLMGRLLFAATETDRLDAFYTWIEAHDKPRSDKLKELLKKSALGFFQTAAAVYGDTERPIADRINLTNRLLAGDRVFNYLSGYVTAFQSALTGKFFTLEELVEHAPAMATAAPRGGHVWEDMAMVHHRQKKYPEALPYWDQAIATAQQVKAPRRVTRFQLAKAETLVALDKTDEARQLVTPLNRQNLGNIHWKKLDDLRKKLGLPALPETAEQKPDEVEKQ